MFGMGGSEILVILIVALLFLGPDKLPDAAKTISKTVRDLKKQTRVLQETIENDEHIGGAIRDLKSALRGDEIPVRPVKKPAAKLPEGAVETAPENTIAPPAEVKAEEAPKPEEPKLEEPKLEEAPKPAITLPVMAGEADPVAHDEDDSPENLASLIKPAAGTVAKNG
jgi:sec-independent protein translocase protein TatB